MATEGGGGDGRPEPRAEWLWVSARRPRLPPRGPMNPSTTGASAAPDHGAMEKPQCKQGRRRSQYGEYKAPSGQAREGEIAPGEEGKSYRRGASTRSAPPTDDSSAWWCKNFVQARRNANAKGGLGFSARAIGYTPAGRVLRGSSNKLQYDTAAFRAPRARREVQVGGHSEYDSELPARAPLAH